MRGHEKVARALAAVFALCAGCGEGTQRAQCASGACTNQSGGSGFSVAPPSPSSGSTSGSESGAAPGMSGHPITGMPGTATGTPPITGAAGSSAPPVMQPQLPVDAVCYELRAHGSAVVGDTSPQPVPDGTRDAYMMFTFMPPWDGDAHAVSFRSLIDNPTVIHHWLLYQNVGGVPDFGIAGTTGQHPDAALLAGWAPGATDLELPDDVGVALGTTGLSLEIHYFNTTGEDHVDASGVEICVTPTRRANTAALHWLGTETIGAWMGGDVSGTCTPNHDGPITILTSWPHMHLKGTHMKSVIRRAGGGEEVLHDAPFDFNDQRSYETPAVIMKGDSILTTCTYSGPAMYGAGTEAEMCYNFVLAYPAGSLRTISGVSLNQNQCML